MAMRVQVIGSRVVEGVSRKNGKPYRFIECEGMARLDDGADRICRFVLPPSQKEVIKAGLYDVDFSPFVDFDLSLQVRIKDVRPVMAAAKAA